MEWGGARQDDEKTRGLDRAEQDGTRQDGTRQDGMEQEKLTWDRMEHNETE